WLARMHHDGKAECRGLDAGDFAERPALVRGDENAVVMLHPHAMWESAALRQTVHVLGDGIVDQLRRNIFGTHAIAALRPGFTRIFGEPDAAGRHGNPNSF